MAFTKYKTISILLIAISALALLYFTFFKKKAVLPEKFSWGTAVSDKHLWPMMVSTARFIEPDGLSIEISEFGPEQEAPLTGKWAIGNGAVSSYNEPLPARIYKGKLSSLMIKGLPPTAAFYHTERMTPQGRQIMQNSVNYYLANSSDSDIRRAVDKSVVPLRFTVNDKLIGGVKGFEINITTDEDDPAFSKTVYFHPRNLYYLMDGNEFKQFGL